jgi:hypothetical protein
MSLVAASRGDERDACRLAGGEVHFALSDFARKNLRRAEELLGGEVVALPGAIDEAQSHRLTGIEHDRGRIEAVAVESDGLDGGSNNLGGCRVGAKKKRGNQQDRTHFSPPTDARPLA